MNQVFQTGRLAHDPELRYSQKGTALLSFSLAVKRKFKKDEVDYIDFAAFGKAAETIAQYYTKGDGISIIGRLETSIYEKNGQKHKSVKVVVEEFEHAITRKDNGNTPQEPQNRSEWDSLGDEINVNGSADDDNPF